MIQKVTNRHLGRSKHDKQEYIVIEVYKCSSCEALMMLSTVCKDGPRSFRTYKTHTRYWCCYKKIFGLAFFFKNKTYHD
jgi:hypothetical protein